MRESLFFFGRIVFALFGIMPDALRVGAETILTGAGHPLGLSAP